MAMSPDTPMIQVENVTVTFAGSNRLSFLGRSSRVIRAVERISFVVNQGETVGVVGESGSGKTTLARSVLRLVRPNEGVVQYKGRNVNELLGEDLKWFRREVQAIFQDPYESLNPAFTVARWIEEPLVIHGVRDRRERHQRVSALLGRVGLGPPGEYLEKYPHELSGGQRQRVAIARALILKPALLIADEPVSMLDLSVRAGVIALLEDLIREQELTCICISHDLGFIRYLCDRTIVMCKGHVVEDGPTEELIRSPRHPYTAALIEAASAERGNGPDMKTPGMPGKPAHQRA